MGDADAAFILGELILAGRLQIKGKPQEEAGLELLHRAESLGSLQARAMLNRICAEKYRTAIHYDCSELKPLADFDGRTIIIKRTGRPYPVDAELSFDGTENKLVLRANIDFSCLDITGAVFQECTKAIMTGFHDWSGRYEVFGGQPLKVKVKLTSTGRFTDSIHVVEVTDRFSETVSSLVHKTDWRHKKENTLNFFRQRRTFATLGLSRWSVRSIKHVFFQSADLNSGDYDELRCIARHEFGHVLGLGDLYASEEDMYDGVAPGSYPETDSFHLYGKTYRMVMCDHHAPITNNDIEMVVLAFSKNQFQPYQNEKLGKISSALGKGN